MKYILPLLIIIAFSCKKDNNTTPTYTNAQIWDSVGIKYGKVYIARIYDNATQSPLDTVIFNADNTITEKSLRTLANPVSKSITYAHSWSGKYYPAYAKGQDGFGIKINPISDTAMGFTFHDYLIKDTITISQYQLFLVFPDGKHSGELQPK